MNNKTKRSGTIYAVFIIVFFMNSATGQTQETKIPDNQYYSLSIMLSLDNSMLNNHLTSQSGDSLGIQSAGPRLLPDNMSIMEKMLWGKSGFFRFTGIAPLTPSSRKNELSYRRTVLSLHQLAGFVTLGLFIPTLIYGQRNINMRNAAIDGRGTFDQNLATTHKRLGIATFTAYMTTAALSIFSPPPLIRRNEWSTISTHKTLAIIHFAGMVATPILAYYAFHAKTIAEERNLQKIHQITAYSTAAVLTASMLIVTF